MKVKKNLQKGSYAIRQDALLPLKRIIQLSIYYLFYIDDYHYEKACFVFASTNVLASGYQRFRGSYGVMSKDGLWVGLERQDCDSFLQIEISKSSKAGVWSLFQI